MSLRLGGLPLASCGHYPAEAISGDQYLSETVGRAAAENASRLLHFS